MDPGRVSFESVVDPSGPTDDERWVVVRGAGVLVTDGAAEVGVDAAVADPGGGVETTHVVARVDGTLWRARPVPDGTEPPPGHRFTDLFSLHAAVDADQWLLAGRAVQVVEWARTHRYCGRCGAATSVVAGDRAMRCARCGLVSYPRLAPAVITLVHRGDEVLLAHGRLFPMPMYSCLAGFVEPGETLEHAVRREVAEEVGVELGALDYRGSQPWPFPHSLMLGFTAEWAGGDIVVDETEIVDARWFPIDDLPAIPPPVSIAHRLITGWVEERRR